MVSTTIKSALVRVLSDLPREDVLAFCDALRDRRASPRVPFSRVEDRSAAQIAEQLVSTFTERTAREVTLELLRQIHCNEAAETLDSTTKACVDKGNPDFRRTSTGKLETKPSLEARRHMAGGGPPRARTPEEAGEGGAAASGWLELSGRSIQFGQYSGQSLKWLLENDVGYVAYLLAEPPGPREQKKKSLTQYAKAYPEVWDEVRIQRGKSRPSKSAVGGGALVGFGVHASDTLRGLYGSKDRQKRSYVQFLRSKEFSCDPGSKMDDAVGYILQCDRNQAKQTARQTTSFSPRAVRERQPGGEGVRSSRRRPSRAPWMK